MCTHRLGHAHTCVYTQTDTHVYTHTHRLRHAHIGTHTDWDTHTHRNAGESEGLTFLKSKTEPGSCSDRTDQPTISQHQLRGVDSTGRLRAGWAHIPITTHGKK